MIPLWVITGAGAGIVAGAAGFGLAWRLADAKLAHEEAEWAQERRSAATKYAAALLQVNAANEAERAKDKMWRDVARSIDSEALKKQESFRAAMVAAGDRINGLRDDTAAANARANAADQARRDTANAGQCAATTETASVYAGLLNRCHQRSIERAGYCTEAVAAGERCERWGDTLAPITSASQ